MGQILKIYTYYTDNKQMVKCGCDGNVWCLNNTDLENVTYSSWVSIAKHVLKVCLFRFSIVQ